MTPRRIRKALGASERTQVDIGPASPGEVAKRTLGAR